MTRTSLRVALLTVLLVTCPAKANDLGAYGETFPVRETNFFDLLANKFRATEADGRIEQLNREFARKSQARIENPPAVPGLHRTTAVRTWLYDPSIVAPRDFADQNGRIFVRTGERINPLERLPGFDKVLVFIDGSDPAEVAFALRRSGKHGAQRTIIVLTAGAPVKLMKTHATPFYYDQQGLLTGKFGITQVPAVVEREGNLLRVREVFP